jgi:GT2 family glycosyltransferase
MIYPKGGTAAERYGVLGSMRNDQCERKGVAKTANIFVEYEVFREFELFPERLISGGDVYWTSAVVDSGYKMVYAEDAVVVHPARDFKELLEKSFRVGRGNVQMWEEQGENPYGVMLRKLSQIPSRLLQQKAPPSKNETPSESTPPDRDFEMTAAMYVVGVFTTFAQNLGRLYAMTPKRSRYKSNG